jgi:hypothetical protein
LNHTPRYLSDQDGAFETRPCDGRAGQCLEQVISTKPIAWAQTPDPFTLTGDANWTDYSVAADVHFLSGAAATISGRIDSSDVFQDDKARWPSGYVLRLKPEGAWELLSTGYNKPVVTLSSGSTALDPTKWHHMELRFRGQQITALLDGASLATILDSAHTHGMFAIGSEWDHVQFDNLSVTP